MILAACALLDENPHPSEEDIKHALDGNTCRCTGYLSIIRSVKRAAALLGGETTGASRPTEDRRLDGPAKVRGEPVYTADLTHPGMLYGRILRSPHAHARIRGIDTAAAEAHPGVVAVLTAADLQDISPYYGPLVKDIPVLATDKVRYEGDLVAAVAAETLEAATAALALIRVEYEPLPPLRTMDEALEPDAPPLHEFVSEHGTNFPGYPSVDDEAKKYANVSFSLRAQQGRRRRGVRGLGANFRAHLRVSQDRPLLHGAAARGGRVARRRDHGMGLDPAPLHHPPGAGGDVPRAAGAGAAGGAAGGRHLRQQEPHQAGAVGGGAGAQGRTAGVSCTCPWKRSPAR